MAATTHRMHLMTFTEQITSSKNPEFAPQTLYRTTADLHEKAAKHYRHAALLQDRGDQEQAQTHANIAKRHAVSALTSCELLAV